MLSRMFWRVIDCDGLAALFFFCCHKLIKSVCFSIKAVSKKYIAECLLKNLPLKSHLMELDVVNYYDIQCTT